MLLEFTLDTKEDDLKPKAIELRKRVAARKLHESIEKGGISDDLLIAMKDENRNISKQHVEESFSISMASVNEQTIVSRSDHQFKLDSQLKRLAHDVNRASRLGKSKIDALSDLERRISLMRGHLKVPQVPAVEEKISSDLKVSNKVKAEALFEICLRCQRRILSVLFKAHDEACMKANGKLSELESSKSIFDVNVSVETSLATFVPKPPRNAVIISKGCSSIVWKWDTPIYDGGLPVFEYEIKFRVRYMEMNLETGRYFKVCNDCQPVTTSLWALRDPIASLGCRLIDLRAGSEYFDFEFRCRNLRGWSEWSSMTNEIIRTEEPEAPMAPLFFRYDKVTSSCIHLAWDPPFHDGGLPIVDYQIVYTAKEKHITVTQRDVVIPRVLKVNTGPVTSFVVRHLMSDIDVSDIKVQAINKAGLHGVFSDLGTTLHTGPCSHRAATLKELDRATKADGEFFDTSHFSGSQQRVLRVDFIKTLQQELSILPIDELETQEANEWAAIVLEKERKTRMEEEKAAEKKRQEDEIHRELFHDEDNETQDVIINGQVIHNFEFNFHQRKEHYRRKIHKVDAMIVSLKEERSFIDKERTRLTNLVKAKQKRQLALKLERDRMKDYTGDMITSDVIHGADMQYTAADFFIRIAQALDVVLEEISQSKFKIMSGEKRKQAIKQELLSCEELLKDRRAAFHNFNAKHTQATKALERLKNTDQDERMMKHYFERIREFMNSRKRVRNLFIDTFQKMILRLKHSAFSKWRLGQFYQNSSEKDYFCSAGSLMLQQALEKREELQALLRETMASTTDLSHKLQVVSMSHDNRLKLLKSNHMKLMEEGINHSKLEESGMHFLYEGDGYAMIGQFKLSLSLYEAQVMYLRSQPRSDIKKLAMCHGRLGKMFLKEGRYDRAIIEFDRQLSLAKEIADEVEMAEAYYGIGDGYFSVCDFDSAIRYLDIAQTRFAALGNMPKHAGALRGLRDSYQRLNKPDSVKMYDDRINTVESELRRKLNTIGKKLDEMKSRLVSTTASIEFVVKIERTTLKALELRHVIEKKSDEQGDLEKALEKQQDKVEEISDMLEAIQKELDEAYETDEIEMMSYFVHDQPQMVDVEEVKTRLHARKLKELEVYKVEKNEEKRLETCISNLEDELIGADQQYALENGALMSHIRHDKPFRFVGLCAANAAGNEVTGTATGGVENFIAAEGHNIHLIDYHSGELLHVFVGDDKGKLGSRCGHTAVVTCLLHDGALIFSGSADETIITWDTFTREKLRILEGHEGSIVSLCSDGNYLLSCSSDNTMRLWDKNFGLQLRVIYGHSMSVLSCEMGNDWILTGSSDEEVRIWSYHKKPNTIAPVVVCKQRLIGHETAISCVKYGRLEVVTGDVLGRIFIWWTQTGEIIRQCKVHDGPVKSLQFDAIHIVSGSTDCTVAITDIATGEPLQSLRGHEGHILAVAFDTERIISVSGDNTLRFWQWGKKTDVQDKFHVLNKGETLAHVCKLYDITLPELMQWNGIMEMRNTFEGMKLIVKKGDPEKPTEAERAMQDRERRKQAGMAMTSKKFRDKNDGKDKKKRRVHKLASDIDFKSLSNRMFWNQKQAHDLFPPSDVSNEKSYSLGSRLRLNGIVPTTKSNTAVHFVFIPDNEDEWGQVADEVAISMLAMLIEYEVFDIVVEFKRQLRDSKSIIGRINTYSKKANADGGSLSQQETKSEAYLKRLEHDLEEKEKKREERRKSRMEKKKRRGSTSTEGSSHGDADFMHTIDEEYSVGDASDIDEDLQLVEQSRIHLDSQSHSHSDSHSQLPKEESHLNPIPEEGSMVNLPQIVKPQGSSNSLVSSPLVVDTQERPHLPPVR